MIFTNPTFEKISTPHGGSILVRKFSYVPRDTDLIGIIIQSWSWFMYMGAVGSDILEVIYLIFKRENLF